MYTKVIKVAILAKKLKGPIPISGSSPARKANI